MARLSDTDDMVRRVSNRLPYRYARYMSVMLLLLTAFSGLQAQEQPTYRREIGVGVGITNYIGDFNGSIFKGFQPEANLLYRRVLNPYSALKMDLSYAPFKGSSTNVTTYYPDYKETPYTFKRTLMDFDVCYEYNFWPYGTGLDYRGAQRITPFLFIGLGATVCFGDGSTVATANVPVGFGVKYKVAERLNLGLEWAMHVSMSDKLDGVKDPYYVNSSGIFKNTDCYSSLRLTVTYSFSAVCPTCNKDDW